MSTHEHFEQEPEDFKGPRLVLIAAVTLLIFAIAVLWSTKIWRERTRDNQPTRPEMPRELGSPEIGMVDQLPFEQNVQWPKLREDKLRRLSTYGWVDKQKGTVHIPIEKAMEQVIAEGRGRK
jgi:hypothetical protein